MSNITDDLFYNLTIAIQDLQYKSQQYEEAINTAYLGLTAFLIFFMQAGFAMLEAGSVTKRNTLTIILKTILDSCVGAIMYWLVGFAFAFGDANPTNGFIGNTYFATTGIPSSSFSFMFWFFEFRFVATATTIVSGAVAERVKFNGYIVHSALMSAWVVPVVSHWVWSEAGWLFSGSSEGLFGVGILDFAGSSVVHMVGGFSSLVAAKIVGYRNQYVTDDEQSKKDKKPRFTYTDEGRYVVNELTSSNPVIATLGVFVLWFGWYGFNCGSVVNIVGRAGAASRVAINMTISASAGGIVALYLGRYERRNYSGSKYSISDPANGILAGLAAITGPCAYVDVWAAFIIGVVAAGVYKISSAMLIHPRVQIDDPVDASPVHAFCGTWGVLSASLFARKEYIAEAYGIADVSSVMDGAFFGGGKRLAAHLIAILVVASWAVFWTVLSFGTLWLLDRNRGEDARFLEKSGKTQKLEFGRAEATKVSTTGFINPDISEMMNMTDWVMDDQKDSTNPEMKKPISRNQSRSKSVTRIRNESNVQT